jgi:hypothetical protein
VHLEGRGDFGGLRWCGWHGCESSEAFYRCRHCFDPCLYCAGCLVEQHWDNPLHRVEVSTSPMVPASALNYPQKWNAECGFFERTTLKTLGLKLQLGCHRGVSCNWSDPTPSNMVIVDITGVHEVSVIFCECSGVDTWIQLLRAQLYPATFGNPSTAFTFEVLRDFLSISFNTRLSQLHWMEFLRAKMDGTGLRDIPVHLSLTYS